MRATDILRSEHETILDVLSALESLGRTAASGQGIDLEIAREALDFLRGFADRCHHGKEEQLLFPTLAARGLAWDEGPLAVMAAEHVRGRELLARMVDALSDAGQSSPGAPARFAAAVAEYVALLRLHIHKENGVLFPWSDAMLSEGEQAALLNAFERFEHAGMGAGAHRRFLELAGGL